MPTRIDSTCNNINLFLSPFLLCSFFKILLGYSCVRIPEVFLVDSAIPPFLPTVATSHQLPAAPPTLTPEICLSSHMHIYIYADQRRNVVSPHDGIGCSWIQRDEDSFILASGSFLWTNGPLMPQALELGFILQVLRLLPNECSITFYSAHSYFSMYTEFCGSSSERRVRSSCYLLWMAIHNRLLDSCLDCTFQTVKEVSTDNFLSRCIVLVKTLSPTDHSCSFNSLMESPMSQQLLVVSLSYPDLSLYVPRISPLIGI
ncbi:hypothetical protein RhiirA4_488792 [Rhizophagus irregularis]|uniref:Uncharacterized protein n=1 Tax=Rhizophagus irregularis TaxID=588596 RepID=A0A2I1HU47_9GLOM|nr:hypothetical protein RhiirA4_488792 [Rhizophagus irregularis]